MKSFKQDQEGNYICEIEGCKYICKSIGALSKHIAYNHNLSKKDYYDKFIKEDNDDKCVHCGNPTSFKNLKEGYQNFCSNKCRYEHCGEKQSKTKLEKFKDQEYLDNFVKQMK
jgi:hypothetical protein